MSIEQRLEELVAKQEISELLLGFTAALDAKDWEAYGDTFVADASFTIMGQTRHGRAAIAAGPARDLERYARLQHLSANHRIRVDPDAGEAQASHYLIGVHVPDDADLSRHADIGGRYDCRCVRTPEGWRFADVVLTILWTAGGQFAIEHAPDPA
jgi:uncharacterized protein (TIGR02246 family)